MCRSCRRSFSSATFHPCYRQRLRQIHPRLRELLVSGVSQRRAARILRINPKTVVRKFVLLSEQAKLSHTEAMKERIRSGRLIPEIQFDELETAERTKCLPLSVPLVVDAKSRRILGFRVCSMPAKGLLAEVSRRKYGQRVDERKEGAESLLEEIRPIVEESVRITSDEKPTYPEWIRATLPHSTHKTVKGRRGAVVGQGELKKIGFDPLFSLNHTCAMLRANINRLFRRTWCMTQRADRLACHLWLYLDYHNSVLIPQLSDPLTAPN